MTYMTCARCVSVLTTETAEACWYCLDDLCAACWDDVGHCGHVEADEHELLAKGWSPGDPLMTIPEGAPLR